MPFPDLLRHLLKERGLSVREFSRRTKRSAGFISDVLHGINGPSDEFVEGWADVLDLYGDERERFLLAGALVRCPKRIRTLLVKLDPKLAELMPAPRQSRSKPKPSAAGRRKQT